MLEQIVERIPFASVTANLIADKSNLRIMIVDDEPFNLQGMLIILRSSMK
mgnify:CR=1 FL=1